MSTTQSTRYGRIRPRRGVVAKAPPRRSSSPRWRSSTPTITVGAAGSRYLLHELLPTLRTGHNVVARCSRVSLDVSRGGGRDASRGETSSSRHRGDERGPLWTGRRAGIVGFAISRSAIASPVLQVADPPAGRFRGCATRGMGRRPGDRNSASGRPIYEAADPSGPHPTADESSLDRGCFTAARRASTCLRVPQREHIVARRGPWATGLRRPPRRGFARGRRISSARSERGNEARRHDDAAGRVRHSRAAAPRRQSWRRTGAVHETCIERFGASRCMFESNFRWRRWHRYAALERVQAHRRERLGRGESWRCQARRGARID